MRSGPFLLKRYHTLQFQLASGILLGPAQEGIKESRQKSAEPGKNFTSFYFIGLFNLLSFVPFVYLSLSVVGNFIITYTVLQPILKKNLLPLMIQSLLMI